MYYYIIYFSIKYHYTSVLVCYKMIFFHVLFHFMKRTFEIVSDFVCIFKSFICPE